MRYNDIENSYSYTIKMSQSLAAAKKRRANFQEPATNVPGQMQSRSSDSLTTPAGLTLPQVIQVVDKR